MPSACKGIPSIHVFTTTTDIITEYDFKPETFHIHFIEVIGEINVDAEEIAKFITDAARDSKRITITDVIKQY